MDLTKGKPRSWAKDNFDGSYLASMETDHKADIKTFEARQARKSGDDAEIKAVVGGKDASDFEGAPCNGERRQK